MTGHGLRGDFRFFFEGFVAIGTPSPRQALKGVYVACFVRKLEIIFGRINVSRTKVPIAGLLLTSALLPQLRTSFPLLGYSVVSLGAEG